MKAYLQVQRNNTSVLYIPERSTIVTAYDIKPKNIHKVGKEYYLNNFLVSNKICIDTQYCTFTNSKRKHLLEITDDQLYEILDRPSIRLQKRKWNTK